MWGAKLSGFCLPDESLPFSCPQEYRNTSKIGSHRLKETYINLHCAKNKTPNQVLHFDNQNGTSTLKEIQIPETSTLIYPQKLALRNKLIYIRKKKEDIDTFWG